MLDLIPAELWAILGTVVTLIASFLIGRKSGRDSGRIEQAERDRDAAIARKEKNNEIEGLDDDERDARLEPWVRKGK